MTDETAKKMDHITEENKHFTLLDSGVICFQKIASNPLPGDEIASISKGNTILKPSVHLKEGASIEKGRIIKWLEHYIHSVLSDLFLLSEMQGKMDPTIQNIGNKLLNSLGVVDRADVAEYLEPLTPEEKQKLRPYSVRLGPVLIYQYNLTKPAAIRLKAMLWSLWYDKTLPAHVPADGITSLSVVNIPDIDNDFYRMIGYPVYGPRAIRVDMLDRLVLSIYEKAEKGVFQARHEMAEWLGCTINDLYAVISALGHYKIEESAPENSEGDNKDTIQEDTDQKDKKPVLASFKLKKGKAYKQKAPKFERKDPKSSVQRSQSPKKPRKSSKKARKPESPRVRTAAAPGPATSNPFAALKDLGLGNKD